MKNDNHEILAQARELYKQIDEYLDEKEKKKSCVFDLDGVLSDYPAYWVNFVNEKIGTNFSSLEELRQKMNVSQYKILKEQFRTCGVRLYMPLKPNAQKVFCKLKESGFVVNVLTARKRTLAIQDNTVAWFRKNDLLPDSIVWDSDKVAAMRRNFKNASFFVEDEARNALPLAEAGFKVYFLSNEKAEHENIVQIKDLREILEKEGLQ